MWKIEEIRKWASESFVRFGVEYKHYTNGEWSLKIAASASIGSRASIGDCASIGDGASIGSRASIGYCASIGDGASIGSRASIGYCAIIGYGASIGSRASIGDGASIGSRASIGDGASIGYGVSISYGASIGKDDRFVAIGPLGSRNTMLTVVLSKEKIVLHTGCFHGDKDKFLAKVADTHGDNEHAKRYRLAVAFAESVLK